MLENRFYAIIVSYNPEIDRLKETIKNLISQGFQTVLIDNHSQNRDEINSTIQCNKVILLDQNFGIAKALNIGMEYCVEQGAEWVLSSDQDTVISNNLLNEYKKYLDLEDVGALCPCVKREDGYVSENNNTDYAVVERCPTSGFFISTKAWEMCGPYDDWMFIDYVDYDMCIRLKINGYKIYRISNAYIYQNLGKSAVIRPIETIGKLVHSKKIVNFSHVYNHSPLRNYYFVRNSLFYQAKYKQHIDAKKERAFMLKWELKKLLLEKNKIKNIKSILKGYRDYQKHIIDISENK